MTVTADLIPGPGGMNAWSVLRDDLLLGAAELVFGPEFTASDVSRLRVLFNTWAASGTISMVPEAMSDGWKAVYPT